MLEPAKASQDPPLLLQQLCQQGLLLALLELVLKLVELLREVAMPKNFLMKATEESSEILDVHVAEVGPSASL